MIHLKRGRSHATWMPTFLIDIKNVYVLYLTFILYLMKIAMILRNKKYNVK